MMQNGNAQNVTEPDISRKKSDENLQKRRFPAFSPGKELFSKFGLGHVLSIANTHLCAKKIEETNDEISRKCQKTGFSGIFPAFSAGKKMFFENWAPSHLGHCHFASLCQKSEKTNEPISRKAGNRRTDGRTNERTDNG